MQDRKGKPSLSRTPTCMALPHLKQRPHTASATALGSRGKALFGNWLSSSGVGMRICMQPVHSRIELPSNSLGLMALLHHSHIPHLGSRRRLFGGRSASSCPPASSTSSCCALSSSQLPAVLLRLRSVSFSCLLPPPCARCRSLPLRFFLPQTSAFQPSTQRLHECCPR